MHITDRPKDLVKSGGEWISSIALENATVGIAPSLAFGSGHAWARRVRRRMPPEINEEFPDPWWAS